MCVCVCVCFFLQSGASLCMYSLWEIVLFNKSIVKTEMLGIYFSFLSPMFIMCFCHLFELFLDLFELFSTFLNSFGRFS